VILYLDTSSLLKLYVDEQHSPAVRDWVVAAQMLATSRVTYPEAAAALARRHRLGDLSDASLRRALSALERQWPTVAAIELHEGLAAELALRHALRGLDAIQLAAALAVTQTAGTALVAFSTFDRQLSQAAQVEGLRVLGMVDP
jgi:predicted nucleic acid-binding protein